MVFLSMSSVTPAGGNTNLGNSFSSGIPLLYLEQRFEGVFIGIEFLQPEPCAKEQISHGVAFATGCSDHKRFRLQLFAQGRVKPTPAIKNTVEFDREIKKMLRGNGKGFRYVAGVVTRTRVDGAKILYTVKRRCGKSEGTSSLSGYWAVGCRRGWETVTIRPATIS